MTNNIITQSIYDKSLEIHYNEKSIRTKEGNTVKLNLKGKIKCPILNQNVSPIVCTKLMDSPGWPRNINSKICTECNCFINLSIQKFNQPKV